MASAEALENQIGQRDTFFMRNGETLVSVKSKPKGVLKIKSFNLKLENGVSLDIAIEDLDFYYDAGYGTYEKVYKYVEEKDYFGIWLRSGSF